MKVNNGSSSNGHRRTFPKKGNPVLKGSNNGVQKDGMKGTGRMRIGKNSTIGDQKGGKKGKKKKEEPSAQKIDPFLLDICEKEGIEYNEEIKWIIYRKCYILLHGIARVEKGELKWNDEQKNEFFFSRVSLQYLELNIHPAHHESELESHLMASYSFFKFLIATGGLLSDKNRRILIQLILKSNESDMAIIAGYMNTLLLAFTASFGSSISTASTYARFTNKSTFTETRATISLELMRMYNGMNSETNEQSKEKDLPSFLAEMYCEIEKNRNKTNDRKKIVFESSDEEDNDETSSQVSNTRAIVNGEVLEDKTMKKTVKIEMKDLIPKRKVKTEVESEDEMEKKERNKKKKESKIDSPNGWNVEMDEMDSNRPSTSNSMSDEFRSNLVDLARESWNKSVAFYSIESEPSVKDRFKMSRFIIECLEEKYGDELLEILQFFTFQSFCPNHLKEKEEVIGLMMYLDQRKLVAESFFFLLLAMNNKENARVALDESEMCCRAQLKAAKIGRSVLLGKPLQAQQLAVNREALDNRKNLEYNKYHIIFPGIIAKDKMKQLIYMKIGENREMKKDITKNVAFADDFWISSSRFFSVDSEWSTYEVNESAVRVFDEMNKMFKGSLTDFIKPLSWRISVAALSDIRSGQSLAALRCMKNAGFFSDSLLFAILRFNDATAMKKTCSRLSRLCTGFKKIVEAGSKSKGVRADEQFKSLKSEFTERAMKVNAECMQFFEGLMNSKGRKRCLSTSSTTVNEMDEKSELEKEPKKKKKKEKEKETEEDEEEEKKTKKRKKKDSEKEENKIVSENESKKIKEEPKDDENEEGKKIKKKKKERKECPKDEDDCQIIEVDMKKVKMELISSDEEEEKEKKKRKRRDSKRSIDGDENEKETRVEPSNVVIKKEEEEEETNTPVDGIDKKIKEEVNDEEDQNNQNGEHSRDTSSENLHVSPLIPSASKEKSILPTDESSWKYNQEWKVTTVWSQPIERIEWEKSHTSDMERLSHRINDFMVATAMREEHYEKKVKVFESIKSVLKEYMEKTESTMDITGSSLCLVGAAVSNLDLHIKCAKGWTDQQAVMDILKQEKGIRLLQFKGLGSIYMTISNESTGDVPMSINIHVIRSTHYMGRVYQMVDHQDERVAALSLVLKAWRILDPSCISAKLQSYHLMIMLIHFLQCGISPPILPSLTLFYPNLDPLFYRKHELPDPIPSENTQSLSSLLIGFFTYYSQFEFEKYIISVKDGCLHKRGPSVGDEAKKITMEHPFDNYLKKPHGVFTTIDYAPIRMVCKKIKDNLTTSFNIPSLPTL